MNLSILLRCCLMLAGLHSVSASLHAQGMPAIPPRRIAPPNDLGQQFSSAQIRSQDAETDQLLRVVTARSQFSVDGSGLTIAVLDTGIRATHVDFKSKIVAKRNFTTDYGSDPNNVNDGHGHGTNVAGVAAARGIHTGIAPGANVIPLKVLKNDGNGSFDSVAAALAWILTNANTYKISVVNVSLGDGTNGTTDNFTGDLVRSRIQQLRQQRIPVVCAAGNNFYNFQGRQGMNYPAIVRETISVGALYDGNLGRMNYGDGSIAYTTAAGRFCPFSQRLHPNTNAATRTDIFVPGAALTSAGIANDNAESTYQGTSQATPVASGLVLLAQQYALRRTGQLPTVDQLENWLRAQTPRTLRQDGDDENDNVTNTNLSFASADAVDLLTAAKTELDRTVTPTPTMSNVTVAYNSVKMLLTITGDSGANAITIQPQGTTVKITAGTGTKVNGTTSVSYNVARMTSLQVNCNMNAGNDQVSFISLPASLVIVNLHDGNDTVTMSYCNVTTLGIDGGAGTDTVSTTTSTFRTSSLKNVP